MAFCLRKEVVDKFKQDLKDGKFNFDKLMDMTSEQRRVFFEGYFGEDVGADANALFESKLILKQQKRGMIDWIRTTAGMKTAAKRDIISRVQRMENILEPGEDNFLNDLAAQKLGVTVTQAEAENISKMAQEVKKAEADMTSSPRRKDAWSASTAKEKKYGASSVAFGRYMDFLKRDKTKPLERFWQGLKSGDVELWFKSTVGQISDSAIAIKASWDNSFLGRQGQKLFLKSIAGDVKSARTWTRTFFNTFKWGFNSLRGKDVLGAIRADIISDPDYDLLRKARIATATAEEEVPTRWPERIPVIGRLFKASDDVFEASAYYMRYRTAKAMIDVYRKSDADLANKEVMADLGKIVNSITSRGGPERGGSPFVKALIWAPKMIRANVDVILLHPLGVGLKTGIGGKAAKVARRNILGIIMGQAMIMGLARMIMDDDDAVELDPHSSNYGKIRIGNTRIDISGGMSSYITLAVRLLPLLFGQESYTKSGTTGEKKSLNENFFGANGLRVFETFFENKLAPLPAVLKNRLLGRTFEGKEPTWKTAAVNLGVPIPVTTYKELRDDPESANILAAMLAEEFGFGTSNYEHISTWPISKVNQEIKDNTYKNTTRAKDPESGKRIIRRKGEPHKGRAEYVKILKEQLTK